MQGDFAHATYSLSQARQCAIIGRYNQAYAHYLQVLQLSPELKIELEHEFASLLRTHNHALFTQNNIPELFSTFERALEHYPDNAYIINDLGMYLYKLGYHQEACRHFQKALMLDVGYVSPEKNLNSVKNLMVKRWHYRMLNDFLRNKAYKKAISETITSNTDTVLDIGTGTGLLSLYAKECKPASVLAIESSSVMADIAQNVFRENNASEISIIRKCSTELQSADVSDKKTLIITEIFDAGLFGEKVLETLIHAWENLLATDGKVLPVKAELYACGAESDHLSSRYRLKQSLLNKVINFASSAVLLCTDEPYDCEDVSVVPDLKYITHDSKILEVNFNSLDDLKKHFENNTKEINFTVKTSGKVDIFVVWFKLYLTEDVVISTDPRNENRCSAWNQAIFYNFLPKEVSCNDIVPVKFTSQNGKLCILNKYLEYVDLISSELLRFLNDSQYTDLIVNSVDAVCTDLCQIIDMAGVMVLDLAPFPLLGLLLLKRGARHLTCVARTSRDRDFFYKIFTCNNISSSNFLILSEDEVSVNTFQDKKFHAIFNNILDVSGDFNVKYKNMVKHLRDMCLAPGGIMMPHCVGLEGRLICCDWLDTVNQVEDINTLGYRVANFINIYQVSQNFHVNPTTLKYHSISGLVAIAADCSERVESKVMNVDVCQDGDVNAVLCWYKVQLVPDGGEICTNAHDSFVDAMVFLANPKVCMKKGDTGIVLCCVDADETLKLIVDVE